MGDRAIGLVVERDGKRRHLLASGWLIDAELRPLSGQHLLERRLPGEDNVLVAPRLQIESHFVTIPGERRAAFRLRGKERAVLVKDISRNATHMVGEHVGPLQVVVVLERQAQPAWARLQVIMDILARGQREGQAHHAP